MKKNFSVMAVVLLALACVMFTACIIESERPVIRGPWLLPGGAPITGVVYTQTPGYTGRPIFVTVLLDDSGIIRAVDIDVSNDTQRYVAGLPGTIKPMILLTNSFNFPITIVSGATGTAQRLVDAMREEFANLGIPIEQIGF